MALFGEKKAAASKSKGDKDEAKKTSGQTTTEYRMSRINLLPWRDALRKERETRFFVMTGIALAISGLIFFGVHTYYQELIKHQTNRNNFLKAEIKKAEKQIEEIKALEKEKERLFARMDVIKKLQASRPEIVHLFDELVFTLPEGVYYTSFKQNGRNLSITGFAQSDARVSTLMRNLEGSDWFKSPRLLYTRLVVRGKRNVKQFALSVTQEIPKPKKEGEEEENG